jgi:hypothetical protein
MYMCVCMYVCMYVCVYCFVRGGCCMYVCVCMYACLLVFFFMSFFLCIRCHSVGNTEGAEAGRVTLLTLGSRTSS